MPVDKHFNKDLFVDKYLVGSSGAEIAFVASEAAYNSIRRTVNIKGLFDKKSEFEISENNIIVEEDFVKAAKSLKDSRQRADTAKWRNIK
jgi:SpoVK/Ycf46/Vps4 family AAA+-type ATPase